MKRHTKNAHTQREGSLYLAVGENGREVLGTYPKWGMMMPTKAHDWLSHLDQSLWLVVLSDRLPSCITQIHLFLRVSSSRINPSPPPSVPGSVPLLTPLHPSHWPHCTTHPSPAACIYLTTAHSAACAHTPRSLAILLLAVLIYLLFCLSIPCSVHLYRDLSTMCLAPPPPSLLFLLLRLRCNRTIRAQLIFPLHADKGKTCVVPFIRGVFNQQQTPQLG